MRAVLIVLSMALLMGCISLPDASLSGQNHQNAEQVNTRVCSTAADCVAEQCCHAFSAVSKHYAPDCEEVACTLNCEPGTLDCGQGTIECVDNSCTVIIY